MELSGLDMLLISQQGSPQVDMGIGTEQSSYTRVTDSPQPGGSSPPPTFCQVPGCNTELTHLKTYCIKKRICTFHMQAESVQLQPDDPNLWRFCQQCGKFEQLNKFDDVKRSCRARLAKRRSGTRAQLLKKGCTTKSDNSSEDAPTTLAATARSAKAASASQRGAIAATPAAVAVTSSPALDESWNLPEQELDGGAAAASGCSIFGALSDRAEPAAAGGRFHRSRCNSPPAALQAYSQSDGVQLPADTAAAAAAAVSAALSAGMCQHSLSAPLLSLPCGAMIGMTNTSILDDQLLGQQSLESGGDEGSRKGRSSGRLTGAGTGAGELSGHAADNPEALNGEDDEDGTLCDLEVIAALQQEMQCGHNPWSPQQFAQQQQQHGQQQQQLLPTLLGAAGSCSSMSGFAAAAAAGAGGGSTAATTDGSKGDNGGLLQCSGLSMPLPKLQLSGSGARGWGGADQPDSPQPGGAWGTAASLCLAPTLSAPLPKLGSCFDDDDLDLGVALFQQQEHQGHQSQQQQQAQEQLPAANTGAAAAAGGGVDIGSVGAAAAAAAGAGASFAFAQQQQQQQQYNGSPVLPAISDGGGAASVPAAAPFSAAARSNSNTSQGRSDGGGGAVGATATSSGGGSTLPGSRLKMLIWEVQMELQKCTTNDIENLDESELSTLLHAALAPAAAGGGSPGSTGFGSTAAAAAAGGGGGAVPFAPQTPAAASIMQQQLLSQLGFGRPGLQQQVGQVQALQQQVEAMRQQLESVRQASLSANNAGQLSGPQLRQSSFDESMFGRTVAAGEGLQTQRSVSCIAAMPSASSGFLAQQQYLMQQQQQQQYLQQQQQQQYLMQQQAASMGMMGMPAMSMAMAAAAAAGAGSPGPAAAPHDSMLAVPGGSGCWSPSVQQEMQQIALQQQQLALQKQQIMRAQEVLKRQGSAPAAAMMAAAAAAGAGTSSDLAGSGLPGSSSSGLGLMPLAATGPMSVQQLGMPAAGMLGSGVSAAAHPVMPQLALLESHLKQAQTMMASLLVQQQASS